jgi:hypothetical protein
MLRAGFGKLRWAHRLKACATVALFVSIGHTQEPAPADTAAAVLNQYCLGCHNARLKTAGLALDPAALSDAGAHAEVWEKVAAKLRSGDMPPAGAPRPAAAAYDAVASFLEAELDRAAAASPNPGTLPLVRRLTRTEYRNVIRDLLLIEDPPREMDYEVLLPADNASSGFDNIADLLFVSPAIMERYLDAARKISRLAVGDMSMPVMVNFHRISEEWPQDARAEELPFGTRGGLGVRSYFPLDAEYQIDVEITGAQEHQLEISVDGERVDLAAAARGRQQQFRVPVQAGPHLLGVTFVQRTEAADENLVRPRMRGTGTQGAVSEVRISGPYHPTGPGDTPARRRLFVCRPAGADAEEPCARRILATLARRAYRRPVTEADLEPLLAFYRAGRAEGGFDAGVQRALERALVSPQFLFRIEREPEQARPGAAFRVSDVELASRLSFFLWSSAPDDELLDAAEAGRLHDPAVLRAQTARMLRDPRSQALVDNFAAQWLQLRQLSAAAPDILKFRDYDQTLVRAFQRETELFLDSVLREDRSILELITANYTFLNGRLAEHYGIPHIQGSFFRRVTFPPDSPRGGLLGQGGILTLTSYPTRTSPVLRGKYVLENLLAAPPPPPPPDVPALKTESETPGQDLPMREAMTLHRASPACSGCHARMDPIGFALENFDAIGQWREKDGGQAIDASGALPDGTKFTGLQGLKEYLARRPDAFATAAAEKLLMYALGRNVQYFDRPAIRAIVRAAARENYTFASLVQGVAASAPFQMRLAQPATADSR